MADADGNPNALEIKKYERDNTPRESTSDYIIWTAVPKSVPLNCISWPRPVTCTASYTGTKSVRSLTGNTWTSKYKEQFSLQLSE